MLRLTVNRSRIRLAQYGPIDGTIIPRIDRDLKPGSPAKQSYEAT